ncbi:DUF3817 domain-containing protein [Catenuloplanes atrovinosus]|uniref:DUF3817 domain-containing protein n=1 Tax=Catenuloplanes atrovinosus TaxID=137266 RepID=A0AAE4C8E0_9ACTN|nr:DUF3817 domain-containing protein [Catenuloplanes atrovinosus]MDR7273689.1 hypothetical protein [Catenuloplanes atrovinosus]
MIVGFDIRTLLRVAAAVEALSLLVLLANLATVHIDGVASLMGPIHGCAYLFVIIAAFRLPGLTRAARLSSLVPGIGGLLVLRLRGFPRTRQTRNPG